jgi:hypothetical protein
MMANMSLKDDKTSEVVAFELTPVEAATASTQVFPWREMVRRASSVVAPNSDAGKDAHSP